MTKEIEVKLEVLKNKYFKYNGVDYEYKGFKPVGANIIIYTDKKTLNFFPSELDGFLEAITFQETAIEDRQKLPSKYKDVVVSSKTSLDIYEPTETQKKLQEALLSSLSKVQESPNHIPQAKCVCDIANTLINMEKNQIALINATKKRG